ncbi:MAG: class I SAM-dependent methyltransferase [Bryobacteraceae bacterium]
MVASEQERWGQVSDQSEPSWYLDPLVAGQKRREHQNLIRRWVTDAPGTLLKTDLFEEAYGADHILFDLFPQARSVIGIDIAWSTVRRAKRNCSLAQAGFFVADVRRLALSDGSVDLIISNSTLDHFHTAAEFRQALQELTRVLRPGGQIIVTMDNPFNPLYWPLRWLSRLPNAPFPLGYITSLKGLLRSLTECGLAVTAAEPLIYNPRLVSTALFLALRKTLGTQADAPIRFLLRVFALRGSCRAAK